MYNFICTVVLLEQDAQISQI